MAWTIPDQGEGSNDLQSEVFQSSLDGLVGALNKTGVVSGCAVSQRAGGANMSVDVAAGTIVLASATAAVTAGTVTIGAADATNPRLDLVVSNGSGTLSVIAGTAAAAPKEATLDTTTYVLLAQVYVPANATSITTSLITDRRPVIGSAPPALFGDGSDGDVTVSTTVTLARDMVYRNLTITGTGRLKTNSSRVFVSGVCTVQSGGSIDADGDAASTGTQGTGGASLGRGGPGGNGGTGASGAGSAGGAASGFRYGAGAGGAGGAGGGPGGAGGAGGGTPNALSDAQFGPAGFRTLPTAFSPNSQWIYLSSTGALTGASGGGGGGASNDSTANGAGGGAGGGILFLAARTIVNNGRISANGGTGGTRSDISGGANKAGGGGGGGGGLAIVHTLALTGNQPQANGGAGGNVVALGGTGTNGSAGTNGTAVVVNWATA